MQVQVAVGPDCVKMRGDSEVRKTRSILMLQSMIQKIELPHVAELHRVGVDVGDGEDDINGVRLGAVNYVLF